MYICTCISLLASNDVHGTMSPYLRRDSITSTPRCLHMCDITHPIHVWMHSHTHYSSHMWTYISCSLYTYMVHICIQGTLYTYMNAVCCSACVLVQYTYACIHRGHERYVHVCNMTRLICTCVTWLVQICVLQCVAGCGRVWQGVAVCCSVLQCVAVCCSVLRSIVGPVFLVSCACFNIGGALLT